MVDRLLATLLASQNEAADDVLLEALRLGNTSEQHRVLEALLTRKTPTGIFGLLLMLDDLPHEIRLTVLQRSGELYHVLPEAGRAENPKLRIAAVRVVALGRLGRMSYVLSENLHSPDEEVSGAAADALVSLSRHVASETRRLQSGKLDGPDRTAECKRLLDMRGDIEAAVYRALDLHGGSKGAGGKEKELLRATLLLCDHPGSKALAILSTSRHGGVSPMVKRLQQTPDAEHVDAFLMGATHGQLRSQFAVAFSHVDAGPVLDGLLRRTYMLKDQRLEICMRQVSRGAWWNEPALLKDLKRREPAENARIADWMCLSGTHDVVQDEKLLKVYEAVQNDHGARLRLLRLILRRPRGASTTLLRRFLEDPDETLQRMAAREIVRRKPADFSTVLIGLMKTGPASVRRVASRAISAGAFENFYERFDRLDSPTRIRAGRAVFKLLPDALQRLSRKLSSGPIEGRLKALTVAGELGLADDLRESILSLTGHDNAKLRSKAVAVAGLLKEPVPGLLLERAINDPDARVRANAIEVLEAGGREEFLPVIAQRARSSNSRERANAIKALHTMKVEAAAPQLLLMLRDPRPEHRISALWCTRHIGLYRVLTEVVRVANSETDARVKRYALAAVRAVAKQVRELPRPGEGAAAAGTSDAAAPARPMISKVFRPDGTTTNAPVEPVSFSPAVLPAAVSSAGGDDTQTRRSA